MQKRQSPNSCKYLTIIQCLSACLLAIVTNVCIADSRTSERELNPETVAQGKVVFSDNCARCHGQAGIGPNGDWRQRDSTGRFPPPPLNGTAHTWHHSNAQLTAVIRKGSIDRGGIMPSFEKILSDQDIHAVLAYIKSLWPDPAYTIWYQQWGER